MEQLECKLIRNCLNLWQMWSILRTGKWNNFAAHRRCVWIGELRMAPYTSLHATIIVKWKWSGKRWTIIHCWFDGGLVFATLAQHHASIWSTPGVFTAHEWKSSRQLLWLCDSVEVRCSSIWLYCRKMSYRPFYIFISSLKMFENTLSLMSNSSSKLFKGIECAVILTVLCTLKNKVIL